MRPAASAPCKARRLASGIGRAALLGRHVDELYAAHDAQRADAGKAAQLRVVAGCHRHRVAKVLTDCAQGRVVRHQLVRRGGRTPFHQLVVALHRPLDAEHDRRDGARRHRYVELATQHRTDSLHLGPRAQHRDERIAVADGRFGVDGSVPLGASRSWKPCATSSERNDSRMPLDSMTMSSSMPAETATPSTARRVRARWRTSEAMARVNSIGQRPNSASGGCARAGARRAAGDDAQHERECDGQKHDVAGDDGEAQRRAIHALVVPIHER